MIFIHPDKGYLVSLIPKIEKQLNAIGLQLHPKKIYLQHYSKGVLFIGQYIKPYRSYISNRTKNNFYRTINWVNEVLCTTEAIQWQTIKDIQSKLNSYLGILKHANAHNLCKQALAKLEHQRFQQFFSISPDLHQIYINKEFWQWHYILTSPYIKSDTIC